MTKSPPVEADSLLGEDLPPSWALTTLGTVTDYGRTERVEPEDIPAGAWVLELEDIEKDSSRILQRRTQSERQSLSTKNRFHAGDVLYGKLRPYLNKVVIADAPGFCTTEIVPVRTSAILERRYLFHWLKHPAFLKYVEAASHGMNMPRLGTDAGKAAPLVLAPRHEQTRIADQLDTLLARIQACQDRLDAIPTLLKRFRQVVCNAAAEGALTEDWRAAKGTTMAWSPCTLADAIDEMRNGLSAKPAEHPPGKRILRIGAVRPGFLDETDYRFLEVSDQDAAAYALRKGDLLFTRYNGTLEFVGACAMVESDLNDYVYPDKLIRVRAKKSVAVPEFLAIAAGARFARDQIQNFVKSSAGQKGIAGGDLKSVKLWLPDIAEQVEIVRHVRSLLHMVERIEAQQANAATLVRRLAPISLTKAFRGELLAQDLNDEPASSMLAGMRAERSAPAATGRSGLVRSGRSPRVPKEAASMTKSRQDDDVMGQPYLAGHLRRIGTPATAEALFKVAELPVADFYKQLAWEVAKGHVKDNQTTLEPGHAAG